MNIWNKYFINSKILLCVVIITLLLLLLPNLEISHFTVSQHQKSQFQILNYLKWDVIPTESIDLEKSLKYSEFHVWSKNDLERNGMWNYKNFSKEQISSLSILGRRSFLHEDVGVPSNKTFLIYIYKFGEHIGKRFLNHYTEHYHDPFEKCSVNNCNFTYNEKHLDKADAVLFHLAKMTKPPGELIRKNYDQRWVWLNDESPQSTFRYGDKNFDHYSGFFNWSMTFRISSDVPVPYGRVVPLPYHLQNREDIPEIFDNKDGIVAVMGSDCAERNLRWSYVHEVQKNLNVSFYGRCGTITNCKGNYKNDCPELVRYKFYMAFENTNCLDYITEKVFWNAYAKKAVPIVMGTSRYNYEQLLPPNSFIYAEDFSPKQLAEYVLYLSNNKSAYSKFHTWRLKFQVLNEHGYSQTDVFHYCRLCEALNYNSGKKKVYDHFREYWNPSRDCYATVWKKTRKKGR